MSPGTAGADVTGLLRLLRQSSAEVECGIAGSSMGSAIPDGATVRIRCDGGTAARHGDVVALLLGGKTLSVHRVVHRAASRRAQGYIVTHGDGNVFCDAPQRTTDLVGVVTAARSGDGAWRSVPGPAPRGIARRLLTESFAWLLCGALEASPRLAFAVKNALVLAITPLVWLRPYDAGRRRSISRLVAVQPITPT